ncbi:MAG: HAD-IA family hydrolase [Nocardioidaceae bacterium]
MKALIFDCDGVLAETERDGHRVAFNRMFAEEHLDVEWTEEGYASALQVAGGKERLRQLCTPAFIEKHGLPGELAALDELVASWHRRKTEIFLELVAEGRMPSRAGVRRLAEEAHASGWRLAVASTSALESVEAIARQALGEDLVATCRIAAGDMVTDKKPAPAIYLHAASMLGVSPEDTVAVEDSRIGVNAAVAAGMRVVATVSHYTADEDLSAADVVVDGLGEPDGSPVTVYQNHIAAEINTHVSLDHVALMVGSPSALSGAAQSKVKPWR